MTWKLPIQRDSSGLPWVLRPDTNLVLPRSIWMYGVASLLQMKYFYFDFQNILYYINLCILYCILNYLLLSYTFIIIHNPIHYKYTIYIILSYIFHSHTTSYTFPVNVYHGSDSNNYNVMLPVLNKFKHFWYFKLIFVSNYWYLHII